MRSYQVRCAEQYGVTFAIEPVARHSVYDPVSCRQAMQEAYDRA